MIEVARIVFVLKRWWLLLVGAALLGGLIAYGLTHLLAKPSYTATATVGVTTAKSGAGPYFATVGAPTAQDFQLVTTPSVVAAAHRLVPQVDPAQLTSQIKSSGSETTCLVTGAATCQLISITVEWKDSLLAPTLANALATVFVQQERQRLEERYAIVHQGYVTEENHLLRGIKPAPGAGSAQAWLNAQYADTAARLFQEDTDLRTQATLDERSLQVVKPATKTTVVGPRASVNAVIGAVLAALVALVIAFGMTTAYGQTPETVVPMDSFAAPRAK